MKNHTLTFPTLTCLLFAFFSLTFISCDKDDDEEEVIPVQEEPEQTNDAPTTPTFGDADGSLWAIKTFTTTSGPFGEIDFELGLGVAVFMADDGTFEDGGTVKLNEQTLTEAPNQSYYYQMGAENPSGIDFNNGVNWSVSGGGSVPAFDRSITFPFPSVGEITSGATVSLSEGYTLSASSVSGADSVLFQIGEVMKTHSGTTTSTTFTAEELSGLSAGTSTAQVVVYAYTSEVIEGENIYFGKESVRSKTVTLEN